MLRDNERIREKRESKYHLYLTQYDEYISASKKEKNIVQEYQGRELLELIQNAEDESVDRQGIIRIKLIDNILTIQNSGRPFSYEGILSLMTANYSAKDSAKFIGNKGLGFRAVLGWSNKISIYSRNLSVSFSRDDARNLQNRLESEVADPSVYQFDKYLIPIFSAPNIDIEYIQPDEDMDTLIRLECKQEAIHRENGIISQLHSINGKELLFLKNTGTIEIFIGEDYHAKFEIIDDEFNNIDGFDIQYRKSMIASHNNLSSYEYTIYQQTGAIEFVNTEGERESKQFLISMAIPEDDAPIEKKLYSFFRTNIESPFNFILNATLELTQSRNDIIPSVIKDDFNAQVIQLLPKFIIQSVKNHLEVSGNIDYRLIKLLVNLDKKFLSINGYNFYDHFIDELKTSQIFPTVNHVYIAYTNQPVFYRNSCFAKHLMGPEFHDLLQWTDDQEIIDFYQSLGEFYYAQDAFVEKINKVSSGLSIPDRIELIVAFVDQFRNSKSNTGHYPLLLVDSNQKGIMNKDIKVFNKPSDDEIAKIPSFLSTQLRFLSAELFKGLENHISFKTTNKIRETIDLYLQYFGVNEYSFKALESSINAAGNQDLTKQEAVELLNWIYTLYKKQKSEDLSGIKIRVNVPCTNKKLYTSDDVYFSDAYDNRFYANMLKTASSNIRFIDKKSNLKMDRESNESLINFFTWLGVNRKPKIILKRLDSRDLNELKGYISNCLTYPAKNEILSDYRLVDDYALVNSYDHFEDILRSVEFDSILKWLLDESRTSNTPVSSKKELNGASMRATWYRNPDRNIGNYYMDSYVRWKLMSTKWIKVKKSPELQLTSNCLIEDIDISPFMYQPEIKYASIKKYNEEYNQILVDQFLSEIKVNVKVKEMSYSRYYQLLLKLPEIDPEFRITRKIYDNLMEKVSEDNNGFEQFILSDSYKKFKSNGKVLSKIGKNTEFFDASKTYYSDKKDLCNGILEKLHMFDIARRSGQEKVSKIFGVQLFRNTKVEILEISPSRLDNEFKLKVENIKPFILISKGDTPSEIKNMKVSLVNSIKIRYSLNDQHDEEYPLKEYENIYSREKKEAYICVPDMISDVHKLYSIYEFYESFAELITVILDVARDKDVYKNLIRDSIEISKRSLLDTYGNKGQDMLDNARKRLGFTVTHEELFWSIIEKTTDQKIDKIKNDYSTFIYTNVNSNENIPLIKSMFRKLKIDIKDFNANSNGDPIIDITENEIKGIRNALTELKPHYESYLYNLINNGSETSKWEKYEEMIKEYDFLYLQLDSDALNSVYINQEKIIANLLQIKSTSEINSLDTISLHEVRENNRTAYASIHAEKYEFLLAHFADEKINDYATFDELDQLYESVRVTTSHPETKTPTTPPNSGLTIDEIKNKIKVLIEAEHVLISPNKIEHTKTEGSHKGRTVKINPQTQLDNGCIAEYFVYSKLKEKYGKVKWISGNALKVLNLKDTDDTKGFDMIYFDEEDNERFVEVKSSQDNHIKIKISKNEVEVGLKNPNKFDIHFVNLNDKQEPVKYSIIKNFFKFQEGEDFFNNSKFSVETDNYDIRAKIAEHHKP